MPDHLARQPRQSVPRTAPTRPTWRDLAQLVRAPAALSVPGDAIAGAAATGTLGRATPGLAAASVCLYWAGMAANDWADRGLDARERPERPIPSGRISPGQALTVAVTLTSAGVGIAALAGGRRAAVLAASLAGTVWAYDLRAKNTSAGPTVMALCRGLDVLLGASGGRLTRAMPAALTVAAHTYTVTALSRREVSGASSALPLVTLAGTAVVAASTGSGHAAARRSPTTAATDLTAGSTLDRRLANALAGWYAAQYGAAQVRAVLDPSPGRVRAAVSSGITSLPQLQGALIARAAAPLVGLAVAAVAPLARRLARTFAAT